MQAREQEKAAIEKQLAPSPSYLQASRQRQPSRTIQTPSLLSSEGWERIMLRASVGFYSMGHSQSGLVLRRGERSTTSDEPESAYYAVAHRGRGNQRR